jgi:nucleoside-diphosphate-sugar epimerase
MAESHLALHSAAVSRSLPEYSNPSDRTFVRIVITGASGNLGTALLRRLAADADTHQVVGVVRRPLVDAGPPYDAVDWVGVDLAEPDAHAQLAPAMAGADAVVHLAWGFQPSHNIAYLDRVGLAGTNAVVSAADAAGVPHLVHLSSLGAYSPGRDDDPVDESWPTEGIDSLAYSKEKVAAERLLDAYQAEHPDGMTVTRIRPALVVQRDAGSALLRYGVPAYVPAGVVRYLPVLPVDRDLVIQVVHSDDVADALVRVLERRAGGAFNLTAGPPITRDDIAEVLGAKPVHLPRQVLRSATDLAWRARLQPLDPGWIDLAFAVPLMDSGRARRELGWTPRVGAREALSQTVVGMAEAAGTTSPVLRPRAVLDQVARLLRFGPITERRLP